MKDKALRLVAKLNRRQTAGAAAAVIAAAYFASQLLGLLRNRLLIAHFGKGATLDAYNAAFRLPDILFTLLITGAFAVAFIPVFVEYREKRNEAEAWKISSGVLNLLTLATLGGGLLLMALADPLVTVFSGGFNPATHQLAVGLTRILLLTPMLFAIANVLAAVQQVYNRFLFFALGGVLYNLGIIAGIAWLAPQFGIYGVAWGVVLGVVLQILLQWGGMAGLGWRYTPTLGAGLPGVKRVIRLMIPRGLNQGIDQINYTVETAIGSFLIKGSITALNLANSLKNVPLALIASSISTATFPDLAAKAVKGDRSELVKSYVTIARLMLFLSIPSAIFAVFMRGYIVRLLYGFGDTDTATTLGWYAGSIVFYSLFLLVTRVYFAMQDTRTPLYVSLVSIPINVGLSIWLSRLYGVAGLSMSASIAATINAVVLMAILRRRYGNFGEKIIARAGAKMLLAGAGMGAVIYLCTHAFWPLMAADRGFLVLAPKFVLISLLATAAYVLPCYLLRLQEARSLLTRIGDLAVRATRFVRPDNY